MAKGEIIEWWILNEKPITHLKTHPNFVDESDKLRPATPAQISPWQILEYMEL